METTVGTDWVGEIERVYQRLRPRFARAEMRVRCRRYLLGLLSGTARKNGWQRAEAVGERSPHGMQALLNRAVWDAAAVRDDLRGYVVEHLGAPEAVLVVDETGFLKQGTKSVGVQRQYSGTAGRIANGQLGVCLASASPHGRALLDRALYLPKDWAADAARRAEAGVPAAGAFHTKPELARTMLERARAAGVPFAWVTGDEVYGGDRRLRVWLEEQDLAHLLAIKATEPLWAATARGPAQVAAAALIAGLPEDAWVTLSAGDGAKGPRLADWAWLPIRPLREPGKGYWLLARRARTDPADRAYYVGFGPAETPLAELVRVAGTRWAIEACLEEAKGEVGLDQYAVRRGDGWHRHVTLCLLAHAVLAVARAAAKGGMPTTRGRRSCCR